MKKIILAIILLFALKTKAQTAPTYTLVTWKPQGTFVDSGNGKGSQNIVITAGIDGDIYGFNKLSLSTVPLKTKMTVDTINAVITRYAIHYVATTYTVPTKHHSHH